ncbi:PTS sugar transporter subunit IIA [Candidatus Latescibacterota bacterium]
MKKISEILTVDRIKDITSVTKDNVLTEMSEMMADAPEVTSPDALLRAIKARESIMSTGIGMGIAIPHAKTSSVTDFAMAVGRSKDGVDYQSLDNLPVHLIILIVASDTQGEDFLKLLGKIGALLNTPGNKEKFLKAKTPEKVLLLFKKID